MFAANLNFFCLADAAKMFDEEEKECEEENRFLITDNINDTSIKNKNLTFGTSMDGKSPNSLITVSGTRRRTY